MARRTDPLRILNAQLAGTRQRLADLDILIANGTATEADRQVTLLHFDKLNQELAVLSGTPQSD